MRKTHGRPGLEYRTAYDVRGNIVSATVDGVSTNLYAYDVFGNMTNEVQNGAVIARDYDAFGRPISYALGSGGAGSSPVETDANVAYSYDALGRLVSDGGVAYAYDAAGNRTSKNDGAATTSYALGAGDRLASWTGGAYSYDAAGCVTRIERDGRPTLDLAWNGQYQLVSVSTNGAFAEGYAYDALGRRVSTTTAEGTLRHVYDDRWQVVADIDAHGGVVASYVWGEGIDSLLAVKVGGASYYPLTDIQGTVWGYADAANNIVARWTYDAWGNVLDKEVSVPALARLRYRFQGREWSAATGLVNFRMRWYDPETGRWLSKDPIGLSGGLNLYAFCGNDPANEVDPWGCSVTNNSYHVVWVKPDNDILDNCGKVVYSADNAYPILPGTIWEYPQDGIAIPRILPGKVFKSVNGVNITIGSDNTIIWKTSTQKFKASVGMSVIGGEKDSAWLEDLHRKHDYGWDKLFEKSNLWLKWKKRGIPHGGIPLLKHPGHEPLF